MGKLVSYRKLFNGNLFVSSLLLIAGCVLLASAFVLFITPYKIIPGGIYGIGIILHYFFPDIQVGTFGLIMDIPLISVALVLLGKKFGTRTIAAAVTTPLIMNLMTAYIGEDPYTMLNGRINLTDDILLACLFGGVLAGAGMGMILRTHATSGGTDIIFMILSKYTGIPFARGLLIVDSIIVVAGLITFGDWKIPLYSLITIYVTTQVIDYILEGGGTDKLLFIISDNHEDIRRIILDNLDRGGTYLKSYGMYTMNEKNTIFVVINRNQVSQIKDLITAVDPDAFITIVNAHEIYGNGFKRYGRS
ncbi:MAG: YitT family protein [Rikenellaceae bacterium]|nr:YitT family protein [Rikenellaceae bacterium]